MPSRPALLVRPSGSVAPPSPSGRLELLATYARDFSACGKSEEVDASADFDADAARRARGAGGRALDDADDEYAEARVPVVDLRPLAPPPRGASWDLCAGGGCVAAIVGDDAPASAAARARAHAAAGVPCVAATSGLREHVEAHLAAAGLGELFPSDRIICAADLPKGCGKPKPDIFLRAAALVGADPARCVAYEDAEAGLEAAWRAGCHVVDVTDYPGYPLPDGLAKAKVRQRAARAWLVEPADAGCGCGPLC